MSIFKSIIPIGINNSLNNYFSYRAPLTTRVRELIQPIWKIFIR
jgi:hypothetical protein